MYKCKCQRYLLHSTSFVLTSCVQCTHTMDMRSLCVSTVSVIRLDVVVFICTVVTCVILCVGAVVFIADANFVFNHVIVTIIVFSVSFLTEGM